MTRQQQQWISNAVVAVAVSLTAFVLLAFVYSQNTTTPADSVEVTEESISATDAVTVSDTPMPTEQPPSATPTLTSTPSPTATLMATFTATFEPTLEPSATVTPLPEITEEPTLVPSTVTPVPEITEEPTLVPSATVTPVPEITEEPTLVPSATVTPLPEITEEPTLEPSATVTPVPEITEEPTNAPSATVTPVPDITEEPTLVPSATVTPVPEITEEPTPVPEITPELTPEITPEITPELTPEITPEITPELTPEITPESTPELTPEITPEVTEAPDLIGQLYTVSGEIIGLPEGSTYTLALRNLLDTRTDIMQDAQYQYHVTAGHYRLTVIAPFHLPITLEFDVTDADLQLPPLELTNGDFDGDGVITERDAQLLILYYGHLIETAPVQMDLNGDNVINLLDLVILTSNFRMPPNTAP